LVAFGAGFVDFIVDFVLLAGALAAFAAGFLSAVFWSTGFFVAFGAGLVAFIDEDFIDDDFAGAAFVLLAAVFGAGEALVAAAIAGAVIRNAAARSDARVFFIQYTSFRSKIRERLAACGRRNRCSVTS
jgi:hypothetical protein